MKRILLALAGAAIATSAANAQAGPASEPVLPANLAATRAALAKYQDPIAAVRDGYLSTVGCMEFSTGEKMSKGRDGRQRTTCCSQARSSAAAPR